MPKRNNGIYKKIFKLNGVLLKQDLVDKLITLYPKVFSHLKHIECDDGWFNLINSLSSIIESHLDRLPVDMQDQIFAEQIKEKFGALRYYVSEMVPYIEGAITLAEDLSNNICQVCGAPGGHKQIRMWFHTLCEEHYKEELNGH